MDEALKEGKLIRSSTIQLAVALTFVHVLAVVFGWYHSYPWIDAPQHFFGGVLAALIFYWVNFRYPQFFRIVPGALAPMLLVISWAVFLGVLFEFTEFLYDRIAVDYLNLTYRYTQLGLADTMGDLFFDILGGLSLGILMRLRYDRRKRQL